MASQRHDLAKIGREAFDLLEKHYLPPKRKQTHPDHNAYPYTRVQPPMDVAPIRDAVVLQHHVRSTYNHYQERRAYAYAVDHVVCCVPLLLD
ncbi:hypothetical protein ACLOJK_026282 [Asimina triloba]